MAQQALHHHQHFTHQPQPPIRRHLHRHRDRGQPPRPVQQRCHRHRHHQSPSDYCAVAAAQCGRGASRHEAASGCMVAAVRTPAVRPSSTTQCDTPVAPLTPTQNHGAAGSTPTTSTSHTSPNLRYGVTYTVTVTAVNRHDLSSSAATDTATTKAQTTTLSKVTGVQYEIGRHETRRGILFSVDSISWDRVPGATSYDLEWRYPDPAVQNTADADAQCRGERCTTTFLRNPDQRYVEVRGPGYIRIPEWPVVREEAKERGHRLQCHSARHQMDHKSDRSSSKPDQNLCNKRFCCD